MTWCDMVDIIYSSEYLRINLSSETLSVPEMCVSWRRLGNQLSGSNRAKLELYTIEFDTTIVQRLNRA